MYRRCIFCSAGLGTNDAVEAFPVGRSVAFDAAKGRLWAVCPKCARWNLAPLEERWEAVEAAERIFHDTRLRVQRENVGLAKLRDGTRLIRVGEALPGEMAAWRYGETLQARRQRHALVVAGAAGAGALVLSGAAVMGVGAVAAWWGFSRIVLPAWRGYRDAEVLHTRWLEAPPAGARMHVRRKHLPHARVQPPEAGAGFDLYIPFVEAEREWTGPGVLRTEGAHALLLGGDEARMVLGRGMVAVNARGARRRQLDHALAVLDRAGSAEAYLTVAAHRRLRLHGGSERTDPDPREPNPVAALALEMALHEETERRVLEGELAGLAEMWRQAEMIADIADRLPDVPAPEPPRLAGSVQG